MASVCCIEGCDKECAYESIGLKRDIPIKPNVASKGNKTFGLCLEHFINESSTPAYQGGNNNNNNNSSNNNNGNKERSGRRGSNASMEDDGNDSEDYSPHWADDANAKVINMARVVYSFFVSFVLMWRIIFLISCAYNIPP